MKDIILWIVTALYLVQSLIMFVKGQPQLGLVLAGYVVANCGLIWAAR